MGVGVGGEGGGRDIFEKAVVNLASRSIHFGKRWVFSFVLNEAKDCKCRTERGSWFQDFS